MSFGNFTLTGHVDRIDGAAASGKIRVEIATSNTILDTAGNKVKIGPYTTRLTPSGDFAISLPSNTTTGDSTTIGYRVSSDLDDKLDNITPVEFYAKPISTTLDISDIVPSAIDPIYPATQAAIDAAQARDDAQQAADDAADSAAAAAAVGASNDTIIAGVVNDPDSATRGVLEPLIESLGGGGGGGGTTTDAAQITTGVFATARIPNLDASKTTSGVFNSARIPNLPAAQIVSGVFDPARIPDLSATYASAASVSAVATQQTQLMSTAASIDEIVYSSYGTGRWSGGTYVQTLTSASSQNIQTMFVAPYACTATSLSIMTETDAHTTSDTDYLTATLQRYRGGTATTIAVKSTKATGGQAIVNRADWNFDGASWDPAASVLQKGDSLSIKWVATGAAVLTWPVSYTGRIRPS